VPFSAFVEHALYDPSDGFYAAGVGSAGRRGGDFLTSPEVGPLFGAVIARAVDGWWRDLGEPDPFVVVEAGAGPGTLARTVLVAAPACAAALRWVLVDRSPAMRMRHVDHLPLSPAAMAFAPEDDDSPREQPTGRGPIAVSIADLPRVPAPCVVLANELLDNLPFDLWERRRGVWWEVRVGLDGSGALVEAVVPTEPPSWLAAVGVADGARVPVQEEARRWLREALAVARPDEGGRLVVVDYCSTTVDLAARPQGEWLRTYRGHDRGRPPLEEPGRQDVTVEVCIDQLATVRSPEVISTQAEWLRTNGIDDLVEAGRRAWDAEAAAPDVAAVRMRSRAVEAPALLDPGGLGAFTVLEWCEGAAVPTSPASGLRSRSWR
jgi:SAM-dependent MidA family methyltransferase